MLTMFNQSLKLYFLSLGLIRDVDRQQTENAVFDLETSPSVLFWATKGLMSDHLVCGVMQGQGACTWLTLCAHAGEGQQRP